MEKRRRDIILRCLTVLLVFMLTTGCGASGTQPLKTTTVVVKVQNQDGKPLPGIGVGFEPQSRDPDNSVQHHPILPFTDKKRQVTFELVPNEQYVIKVFAGKTVEKSLQVPERPVTVEITVEGGDHGVKGKDSAGKQGEDDK